MKLDPLRINNSYLLRYEKRKWGIFKDSKELVINVDFENRDGSLGNSDEKSYLNAFGINTDSVCMIHDIILRLSSGRGHVYLFVYQAVEGKRKFKVLQLMDIYLEPKFQNLGIGSQLIKLIEEICKNNSISYIFGILQKDEALERRKGFFIKNGFQLRNDPRFPMSNIGAAKQLISD
ncbi:MAG TPA: GNAT family N-acetyltransferase [Candidatus Peribacteraceae bacterium]|nr:GNAT family N-acetyltransferase [Candidatus Peribacteraceae bacterium]